MADTAMQADVVRARLTQLELLLDDVDRHFPTLRTVQQRQGSAMWTDIPACAAFARTYTEVLQQLEGGLTAIRANVQVLLVNLALSARDLTRTEEDIRERMIALAEKLNAMPVIVPPPGGGTPVDSSAGFGGTVVGSPGGATSSGSGSGPVPV